MSRSALLLLDLDGVCALERTPPDEAAAEIFRLHEDLGAGIAALGCPVAVITHRSRKEALRILSAIGVGRDDFTSIFSAEDFLRASFARPFAMFRQGLLKSAALPAIVRKFGMSRENFAIVDDRDDVLLDLQSNGLGLCMRAPSQSAERPDEIMAFEFPEAARIFTQWRKTEGVCPEIRRLTPRPIAAPQGWRTGKNTRLSKLTVFSTVRGVARYARQMRRPAS